MKYKEIYYPEVKFGGYSDIDGTVAFYNRVNSLLHSSFAVLDVGCGRGACADDPVESRKKLRILKGKVSKVIGIDVDVEAKENPYVDEIHLIKEGTWPIERDSIDLVLCDNVIEHSANPETIFSETRRVLKDGGLFCLRTPNRLGYVALFSQLIPDKYHYKVKSVVQNGCRERDVFTTEYRCNTVWQIKRMMNRFGFDSVVYGYEAEPSYLAFSNMAYGIGVLYQKYAPGFLKSAIFAFGKLKKSDSCFADESCGQKK